MADGPKSMQFPSFIQTYFLTVGVLDYMTVEFANNILILSGLNLDGDVGEGGLGQAEG